MLNIKKFKRYGKIHMNIYGSWVGKYLYRTETKENINGYIDVST